ncbi:uncharacterized protein [Haliotis asinina]|uniref:uncharacterized protein n=1 Tax=Haliotis asinina TaxID=109174 RepID=UPI003531F542
MIFPRPATMMYSGVLLVILVQSATAAPTSSPCISEVHCDMDNNTDPLCGFTATHWKRGTSLLNGPQTDASNKGHFVYVAQSANGHGNDGATLASLQFCKEQTVCVSAMYWHHGNTHHPLTINVTGNHPYKVPTMPQRNWTEINKAFQVTHHGTVIFRSKFAQYVIHALDDINITEGNCGDSTSIREMSSVRGLSSQTFVFTRTPDTPPRGTTSYTTTLQPHTTTSPSYDQSPTSATVNMFAQQILDRTVTLSNHNEACMHLNKDEGDSLLLENDIVLSITRRVQIYHSDLQNKQMNLQTLQTLTNTNQAVLLNEQSMMVASAKKLVTNIMNTRLILLSRHLDFVEDQLNVLQVLQGQLAKNNYVSSLQLQERALLHRDPDLFRMDGSSLSPEEQLQQQATLLQLQASLLHNDALLTQNDHNMTACLDQVMISVLSLREDVLHYKRTHGLLFLKHEQT